jgi:hypothetical protein
MSKSILTRQARSGGGQKFKGGSPKSPASRPNYAKGVTGGGSSKMVTPPIKPGSRSTREATPHVANREGKALGDKVMGMKGTVQRPYEDMYTPKKEAVRLGNDLATNVGRGGPGAGRTIYRSGSQGLHGNVRQGEGSSPGRRDILSEFGRESKPRSR